MFRFVKQVFFVAMTFFNFNPSNVNSLECFSMNNQKCKTRTKIININNNKSLFYPFSIKVNKGSGSCNNINNPYAKLCIPDVVKNTNVKVFNLMSWSNQTKHMNGIKLVNANVDQIQVFVIINKDGMKINAGVNVEN